MVGTRLPPANQFPPATRKLVTSPVRFTPQPWGGPSHWATCIKIFGLQEHNLLLNIPAPRFRRRSPSSHLFVPRRRRPVPLESPFQVRILIGIWYDVERNPKHGQLH